MVRERNDIYLREIQAVMAERVGIKVSLSSLSRTMHRLKLNRKKNVSGD